MSSVGIAIFADLYAGLLFMVSHYLSAILIGLFFPCSNIIHENYQKVNEKTNKYNIKQTLSIGDCILKCFNTLIIILGFALIFNILSNIITQFTPYFIKNPNTLNVVDSIIYGISEISIGILKVSKLSIPYVYKMCITSFICSFGSISVMFQIYTVISKHGFKFKDILFYKFIHGILSFIITYILISNFVIFQSPYL